MRYTARLSDSGWTHGPKGDGTRWYRATVAEAVRP